MASQLKRDISVSYASSGTPAPESKKRTYDGALVTESRPISEAANKKSHEEIAAENQQQREAYEALLKILDGIDDNANATFATSGSLPNAANPGLFVKDLGGLGLPISEHDAHRLSSVCHQAPFGKGSETIVDTHVRKTLELNPSQFELKNPAWQQTLETAVAEVANGLGLAYGAASVRADLYKLLLYEEGAFFDRHRELVYLEANCNY